LSLRNTFNDNSTKMDSLNLDKKGQNTNYSHFVIFKRDSGMKLAQFPSFYFHSIFVILTLFVIVLYMVKIK
jgi:hypothetical protein